MMRVIIIKQLKTKVKLKNHESGARKWTHYLPGDNNFSDCKFLILTLGGQDEVEQHIESAEEKEL